MKIALIGVIVGFVGIFVLSPILSPLAIILGIIGIFRFQIFSGPIAIFFGIIGILTSPIILGFIGLTAVMIDPIFFTNLLKNLLNGS